MVWRKINTRVQSSGAGGQNKDNIRNRGAITPKGVKESKECTGVWTSQRIATCKKSLDPKKHLDGGAARVGCRLPVAPRCSVDGGLGDDGGPCPGDQRVVWGLCRGFNRP